MENKLGRALYVMCGFYANDGPLNIPGSVLRTLGWALGSLFFIGTIEFAYALFRRPVPLALRYAECFLATLAAPVLIPYSALLIRFNALWIPAIVSIALAGVKLRKRTVNARLTFFLFVIWDAATLYNILAVTLAIAFHIHWPTVIAIAGFRIWL